MRRVAPKKALEAFIELTGSGGINTFGKALAYLRRNYLGYKTKSAFCCVHGFDISSYSKLERGLTSPPRVARLERYRRAFGLSSDSFEWWLITVLADFSAGRIPTRITIEERRRLKCLMVSLGCNLLAFKTLDRDQSRAQLTLWWEECL